MPTSAELLQQRAQKIAEARAILEKAKAEKREASAEERQNFDKAIKDAAALKQQAEDLTREELLTAEERALAAVNDRRTAPGQPGQDGKPTPATNHTWEYRGQQRVLTPTHPVFYRSTPQYNAQFRRFLLGGQASGLDAAEFRSEPGAEERALEAGSNTAGGYLVPVQFIQKLIVALDTMLWVRKLAFNIPVLPGVQQIGCPTLATHASDAEWTTELVVPTADSSITFGKRQMSLNPLRKLITCSKTLLRASGIPAEDLVIRELARAIGIAQEKAYMTGTGDKKPLGLFTASNAGIPTSRDVSTGNEATAVTFDGLINCKYSLAEPYRNPISTSWLFHGDVIASIAKLKDGDGKYIWRESVVPGEPDRILGFPVRESAYAPNTQTAGLYVGLLGDFQHYWIADGYTLPVQRLVELLALSNQDGFIAEYEGDGAPVQPAAFARVKLGA